WYKAALYIPGTATGSTRRVTNDGEAKWSVAIDPAGRRVAFCTADGYDRKKTQEGYIRPPIKVAELPRGEPTEIGLAAPGFPSRLTWSPDGSALVYDERAVSGIGSSAGDDEKGTGTYSQTVPAPKPAPKDAKLLGLPFD